MILVSSNQVLHQIARKKRWIKKILGPTVRETSSGLTPLQVVAKEFDQYFHYPKVDLETNPLEW